jgi:hypothetical protein
MDLTVGAVWEFDRPIAKFGAYLSTNLPKMGRKFFQESLIVITFFSGMLCSNHSHSLL